MSTFDWAFLAVVVAFISFEIYRHRTAPSVTKALSGFQKLANKLEAAATHHSVKAENAQLTADTEAANAEKAATALAAVQKITG